MVPVRLKLKGMKRQDREVASNLIIGYEADAMDGIEVPQQVFRLQRWRRQGWSSSVYHTNIFAMFIGYARARNNA